MAHFRTDDPYKDFLRHEKYMDDLLEKSPVCCCCGEHIQQYDAVKIQNDFYCDDCLDGMRETIEEW